MSGRNVTADNEVDPRQQYEVYRLCECDACGGTGRQRNWADHSEKRTCPGCRGEGRTSDLVAACETPEALGVALVTLGREGEWEGCPIGILHRLGEPGEKWIVRPWLPSARNLSDAGRQLQTARRRT